MFVIMERTIKKLVNIRIKPCEYASMTITVANLVSIKESYPRLVVTTGEIIG